MILRRQDTDEADVLPQVRVTTPVAENIKQSKIISYAAIDQLYLNGIDFEWKFLNEIKFQRKHFDG